VLSCFLGADTARTCPRARALLLLHRRAFRPGNVVQCHRRSCAAGW
jgi:hypothetical protein